jgi:hypothetical protein
MRGAARGEVRSGLLRQDDEQMQRVLILLGLVMVAAGLAWPWLRRIPLGRLPGDIHIVREGFSFHFPIVSCIVVSLLVSLILWIFRR